MSFRVIKTINNNVVSCQDENGCEYIVMGRGLGFGVKSGHTVEREQAEKVFSHYRSEQHGAFADALCQPSSRSGGILC